MKVVNYYFNALMENVSALGGIFTHLLLLAVAFILNDAVFSPLLKGLILIYVIIMYSRIHLKKHYWSDVIGGVITGVVSYYLSLIL